MPRLILQRRWVSEDVKQDNELIAENPAVQETETPTSEIEAQDNISQPVVDTQSTPTSEEGPEVPFRRNVSSSYMRIPPARNAAPKETIYVGNLFFDVTAEDLKKEFSRFGPVASAKIVCDSRGLSRG